MDNPNILPLGVKYERLHEGFIITAYHHSGSSYLLIPYLLICAFYFRLLAYKLFDEPDARMGTILQLVVVAFSAILYFMYGFLAYIRVKKDRNYLEIFTGIKAIGLTRRLRFQDIHAVRIADGIQSRKIVLEEAKQVSFGRGLTEKRREFIVDVLQKALAESKQQA